MRQCPICHKEKIDDSGRCTNICCTFYSSKVLEEEITEQVCPECEGGCFKMECYGGNPVEVRCEECYGTGMVDCEQ